MSKLDIKTEMAAFDRKDRNFFDSLDEEEKKKFSPYLMIRWGATVKDEPLLENYYLMNCNETLNKYFFNISTKDHKKLQWLLATTVSPGAGVKYHPWIAPKKKDSANNKSEKFLATIFPHLKDDEIKLLAKLNDKATLKELAKQHGYDDKAIKDLL